MLRLSGFKLLIAALLAGPLVLGGGSLVTGGAPEPPTGGEHLRGPAIVGTAILDGTNLTFTGSCKGQPVVLNALMDVDDLPTLTADDVEGFRIRGATSLVPQCYDIAGDLIVNTVTKFTNNGVQASADVVVLAVVAP